MVDPHSHRSGDLLHDLLDIVSIEFVHRIDTVVLPIRIIDAIFEHSHGEGMAEVVMTVEDCLNFYWLEKERGKSDLDVLSPIVAGEDGFDLGIGPVDAL